MIGISLIFFRPGAAGLWIWFGEAWDTGLEKWMEMGVSWNCGTPNHPFDEISIINYPFWGIPIFGNTQIMTFDTKLVANFITEAMNHHSIKPCKVPTDGPWPAAKLMKKLVTLGPDAWNSGKYTGDRLGMNGYFVLFCEISCDTEFDTVFFSCLESQRCWIWTWCSKKLWKKWTSKMESFYQISSFHVFQRSRLEMVLTLGLYWFWAMPWHQRWSATWRSWPRQVDGATGFCFLYI